MCASLHKTEEIFKVASVTQDQRLCGETEREMEVEKEVEQEERTE